MQRLVQRTAVVPARMGRALRGLHACSVGPSTNGYCARVVYRRTAARPVAPVALSTAQRCSATGAAASDPAEVLKRAEVVSQLTDWNDSFAEARELIRDATESVGTTYFDEDMQDAVTQTEDAINRWSALKKHLSDLGEKPTVERLEREHEVKMRQLKEELEAAKHAGGQ